MVSSPVRLTSSTKNKVELDQKMSEPSSDNIQQPKAQNHTDGEPKQPEATTTTTTDNNNKQEGSMNDIQQTSEVNHDSTRFVFCVDDDLFKRPLIVTRNICDLFVDNDIQMDITTIC